jgi:flagellar motor switch protein FliM
MRIEGRPYTTIERSLVQRMIHVVLADLGGAFEPLSKVDFTLDRLETDPRFATIARNTDVTLRVRVAIEVENRVGHIDIVIPNAALDTIRDKLVHVFMGEKFGHDTAWESHFKTELQRTSIELVAVLHQSEMPLEQVLRWTAGDALDLRISPDSQTVLVSGEIRLFSGQMGQRNENIAVMIETDLETKGELIDGFVPR